MLNNLFLLLILVGILFLVILFMLYKKTTKNKDAKEIKNLKKNKINSKGKILEKKYKLNKLVIPVFSNFHKKSFFKKILYLYSPN